MKKAFLVLAALALAAGCGKQADTADTLTDSRDGKKYKTVKIGGQVWMAENLNYEAEGSKCYGDDPANCEKYGRLYDWETAMKTCPAGWHLPSDKDWQTLVDFAGGNEVAGKKLKAKTGWYEDGNGTDDVGFSALPGGSGEDDGSFERVGEIGYWWTAYKVYSGATYFRAMVDGSEDAGSGTNNGTSLFSVRCVKDTGEQTAAEKDEAAVEAQNSKSEVQFNELENKNGVYYLNNVPFTGTAEGFDYGPFIYTMKDGIYHGPYSKNMDGCNADGTYKNGKKHGEWKDGCGDELATGIYEDDKKQGEWKYFSDGKLYLTQTYENDVLIRENGLLISEFEKLVQKKCIYYLNNAPFTGKSGYQRDMHESWEFKDGKFHGKYSYYMDGCDTKGTYKNGRKHGKWEGSCSDGDGEVDIRIWENGVEIRDNEESILKLLLGTWKSEEGCYMELVIKKSGDGGYSYVFTIDAGKDTYDKYEGNVTVSSIWVVLECMPMANTGGIYKDNEDIEFSLKDGKLVTQNSGDGDSDWAKLPCGGKYISLEKVNN